jgi:hypothetical protein
MAGPDVARRMDDLVRSSYPHIAIPAPATLIRDVAPDGWRDPGCAGLGHCPLATIAQGDVRAPLTDE